jgi:hypothetical protein
MPPQFLSCAAYLLLERIRAPLDSQHLRPSSPSERTTHYLMNKNGKGMKRHARPPSSELPPPIPR